MGQLKTKDASKTRLFSVEVIYHLRLSCERKTTTHFKVRTYTITHAKCCTLLCCTIGPSLSIHFLLIILIAEQSLFTVRIMTVSFLTTELIPRTQAMWINRYKIDKNALFRFVLSLWSDIWKVSYIELRILKQSELLSSQLWTQFEQVRVEAWKSQDFNGVSTRGFIAQWLHSSVG